MASIAKKSPTKKTESIENLLDKKRWTEVRKRMKRISSPERVGEILYHGIDDPDIPDDTVS